MTYLAAFDFETHWMERGVLDPRPVCMSHGTDRDMANVALMAGDDMWRNAAGVLYRYLTDPDCIVTGVNLPFDFAVAVSHLGLPLSVVVEAIESGRVRTVDIRENLIAIANGWTSDKGFGGKVDPRTGKTFSRSLAAMVMAYYGVDISGDKKDPTAPRKRYHEMDGVPLDQWPGPFRKYPKDDITWPISIYKDQLDTPCTPIGPLVEDDGRITNETEQLMAQFVLHVMAMNGPRTDPRVAVLFRKYHEEASKQGYDIGKEHGFLRWNTKRFEQDDGTYLPGWSEKQADMKRIVADSWGNVVPQAYVTETGVKGGHCLGGFMQVTEDNLKYVALSQEALEACSDKRMQTYAKGANSRKMINQYAPILELALTCPLTSSPNVLVNTGRTSWRDPNLQNPPREGGFREGLVARDGCLFAFADYSFVELVTLAQLQLWEYGRSTLADVINAGQDPHAWFGANLLGISYEEMGARLAAGDKAAKNMRQAAKACFVAGTEVYTKQGWVAVDKLTMDHDIGQVHMPEERQPGVAPLMTYTKPLRLTTRWSDNVIRLQNESVDIGLTGDHRVPTYNQAGKLGITLAQDLNGARHWASAVVLAEGDWSPDEAHVRLAVATQADGSVTPDGALRFGFSKDRKKRRFEQLLDTAGIVATTRERGGVKSYYIRKSEAAPVLGLLGNDASGKGFHTGWLRLVRRLREAVIDEVAHWDSSVRPGCRSFKYSNTDAVSADILASLSVLTGRKTSVAISQQGRRADVTHVASRDVPHTRGGSLRTTALPAQQVYCLTVPTETILVRSGGKHIVVKNCNFGFPGGMGPARVVETYKVKTMMAIALDEDMAWQYDASGQPVVDEEETAINVARRLKTLWLDAFPEQQMVFNEVASQTANGRLFTFRQRPYGDEPGVTVKSGRIRGQVGYCDGCNTRFQGLAADVIKAAMWDILKACYLDETSPLYGCRPWLLLHDELGVEGPKASAHDWAHELSRLMVAALARYCPDVIGKAGPALCRRWYKAADEVLDNDGRLAPWEPWRRVRTDGEKPDPVEWHAHTWVLDHCWGVQAFVDGDLTYDARIEAERNLGIVT